MSIISINQNGAEEKIDFLLPEVANEDRAIDHRVRDALKPYLRELATNMLLVACCMCFVDTPQEKGLMGGLLVAHTFANFALKKLTPCLLAREEGQPEIPPYLALTFTLLPSMIDYFGVDVGPLTLIHELGHATAQYLMYSNIESDITLHPYATSFTNYHCIMPEMSCPELMPLAEKVNKLNPNGAELIRVAGGPMMSVAFSTVLLILGFSAKNTHPDFSKRLLCSATLNILSEAEYAITSFVTKDPTFDYTRLWEYGGVNPLITGLALASIPIFMFTLHYLSQHGCPARVRNFCEIRCPGIGDLLRCMSSCLPFRSRGPHLDELDEPLIPEMLEESLEPPGPPIPPTIIEEIA